jgi:hypothetical protein
VAGIVIGQAIEECAQAGVRSKPPAQSPTVKTTRLVLRAPAPAEPAQAFPLLPAPAEVTNDEAGPLFEKIAHSLPAKPDLTKVNDLTAQPVDQLPVAEAEALLRASASVVEQLHQAARCRSCEWPAGPTDTTVPNRDQWRYLTFLLSLEVHQQMARGQYPAAVGTLRTGFAIARHLAHGPTPIHGLTGVGVAARMCRDMELFVQQRGAPSLSAGLTAMPQPFLRLEEQMDSEGVDEDTRRHIRLLTGRVDRHLASLQCLEALRLYAAKHNNTFPQTLSQITDVTIPADPLMGAPFVYRRDADKAFLEAPVPTGGDARDALQYELSFKQD